MAITVKTLVRCWSMVQQAKKHPFRLDREGEEKGPVMRSVLRKLNATFVTHTSNKWLVFYICFMVDINQQPSLGGTTWSGGFLSYLGIEILVQPWVRIYRPCGGNRRLGLLPGHGWELSRGASVRDFMGVVGSKLCQFEGRPNYKLLHKAIQISGWIITTKPCSPEPWKSCLIRGIIPKWPNYSG